MRDETDEQQPGEEEDADGEYGVSSIEYGEEEAGPGEGGEVGAGVVLLSGMAYFSEVYAARGTPVTLCACFEALSSK